jgi:Tfp pilus assembly protein PilF
MSTADGQQLWTDKLDERFTDIFAVQDSISERVAEVLAVRLTGEEQKQLTKRYTENAESLQFYLRGRYYRNKRTPDWVRKAVEQFRLAIDRDPNYALSYVGLADSYSYLAHYGGMPESEALPKARAAVDRALQLDDSLAEAHTSSAFIHQQLWQWAEAEREYKRAISLNPNYPTGHHWFSEYLKLRRQFDDALREIRRAQELDPISLIINVSVAELFILKNDFDSAIEQLQKVIELEPSFPNAHSMLACAYFERARYKDATAEQQKAVELSGRRSGYLSSLGCYYAATGRRAEAVQILKELEARYAKREASGQSIAFVNIAFGDKDQALKWLENDFQQHRAALPEIADWFWDDLHSDPRYLDLLRRMGLDP